MRRLIVLLVVLLPVSLFVGGCGGGGTSGKSADVVKDKGAGSDFAKQRMEQMKSATGAVKK